MANENVLGRLGGGVAKAVAPTRGGLITSGAESADASMLSSISNNINDIIKSTITARERTAIQRNQEDRIRAVNQAEIEHLDANNALDGASYDDNLNTSVSGWRSSGLTNSEIRLKIKDYKWNKAKTDLGIDDSNKADDVNVAYFDTFQKLELKALAPILQEDRKVIQDSTTNMNASYVRTSSDDLQTKYNNIHTTNQTYGMGETESISLIMGTAFDMARNGDDSMLKELQKVKTAKGDRIVDTALGADIYTKMNENLMAKREHDEAKRLQQEELAKEATANKLYADMIVSDDIHAFKIGIDNALSSNKISAKQHQQLNTYYKTITDVSAFPKNSDIKVQWSLRAKAEEGTLTQEEFMQNAHKLTQGDAEAIMNRQLQQGGVSAVGTDLAKILNTRIEDDAKAYSGLNMIDKITTSIDDAKLADKRYGYIKYELQQAKNLFVAERGKLWSTEEYIATRDRIVSQAEKVISVQSIKPPVEAPRDTTKSKMVNGTEALLQKRDSITNEQEYKDWVRSLTPAQRKIVMEN